MTVGAAVVDVPEPVARFLGSYGALKADAPVLNGRGKPVCQVSAAAWARVESGLAVGAVLQQFFQAHNSPVAVPRLQEGGELRVRLHNWNLLVPLLSTFGVDLSGDAKALVVAGDTEEIIGILYQLSVRVGPASGSTLSGVEETDYDESVAQKTWKTTAFQLAGLYSIMVACLLSIFIQQQCSTETCTSTCTPGGAGARVCTTTQHACSFEENLRFTNSFGKLAVAFNFITLAVFLVAQLVFYHRERWLEQSFGEDKRLTVDNLAEEVKLYPTFKRKLEVYNSVAVWLSGLLMAFLITNLVLSSINILRFHYAGKASVIGLLSNTGLVLFKVLNWFTAARESNDRDVAISFFSTQNHELNTIAPRWRFNSKVFVPQTLSTASARYP